MSTVRVFCNNPNLSMKPTTAGSAAIDLVANIEDPVYIYPGEKAQLIPTGLKLDMTGVPALCALILPRSGLGHRHGLVLGNGIGLIDNDYQGEVMVSAWNRNAPFRQVGMSMVPNLEPATVNPGDRIAQLLFLNFALGSIDFAYVSEEEFTKSDRGDGGFGSTGVSTKTRRGGK